MERQSSLSHIIGHRRASTLERHSKPAFSPFDRLPVELHAEIFSHCLDAFPRLDELEQPPTTIARVCGAWRALVFATPKLWASFEIEVQDYEDTDGDFGTADHYSSSSSTSAVTYSDPRQAQHAIRLLNSVHIWLERSRNHPLSVRVIHMPSTPVPGRLSGQLLATLVAHASRWRDVQFMLPSTSLGAAQRLFPEDFPSLKHLKIHMKGQWNGGGGTAPAGALRMGQFPWTQLTSVNLRLDHAHMLNLDAFLELLSDATSLVDLSFNAICALSVEASRVWRSTDSTDSGTRNSGAGASQNEKQRVLRLPSLERLHIVLQSGPAAYVGLGHVPALAAGLQQAATHFLQPGDSLVTFLSLLAPCKLTQLHLDWLIHPTPTPPALNLNSGNGQWDPSIHTKLQDFLRGLKPTLRSLQLGYLPLGEDQLMQCLAQLSGSPPGIRRVAIDDGHEERHSGEESMLETLDLRFPIADHEQDPITDRFLKSLTLESSQGQQQQQPHCSTNATPAAVQPALGAQSGTGSASGSSGPSKLSSHFEALRRNAQSALGVVQSAASAAAPVALPYQRSGPDLSASANSPSSPTVVGGGMLHFPRLERIRLRCSGERCSAKELVRLVNSRSSQRRKFGQEGLRLYSLKQFHIYSMTGVLPDAAQYVDTWKKAGVDVVVESVMLM